MTSGRKRKPSLPRTVLSISIPLEELSDIDKAAYEKRQSRSEFMREASLEKAARVKRRIEREKVSA
jgi:metal-responsive CopG/Arc/MetJ family transcriptional regulator